MNWNRAVIKVGSALVAPDSGNCSGKYLLSIARFITECLNQGKEIILVSSGSVAAGRPFIHHGSPNVSIQAKQAMASVGQTKLMANWQRFFDVACSQLLITHGDLKDRQRYINIKNTLRILLENNILPIVNENDTVATDELKVGDNDNLAALVALVSEADCLFILSDVDGVFNKDPNTHVDAKKFAEIEQITAQVYAMAGGTNNNVGTGGMKTKIQAAEKATENGIETYIVNGKKGEVFEQLLSGGNPGTKFVAKTPANKARKHWLKHTLKSSGILAVDAGAQKALEKTGASLLASGIKHVDGDFIAGESVDIVCNDTQKPIAKGICQYSSSDLRRIQGKKSQQIIEVLGYCPSTEIVHRDDMIVVGS